MIFSAGLCSVEVYNLCVLLTMTALSYLTYLTYSSISVLSNLLDLLINICLTYLLAV